MPTQDGVNRIEIKIERLEAAGILERASKRTGDFEALRNAQATAQSDHATHDPFDQQAAFERTKAVMVVSLPDRETLKQRAMGKAAFDAYRAASSHCRSEYMGEWAQSPEEVQVAWVSAAEAARSFNG